MTSATLAAVDSWLRYKNLVWSVKRPMLCKNCCHAAELHDPYEGFCRARISDQELAIQNASDPERCDCLAYEPDGPAEEDRLIETIQNLLDIEKQSLEDKGRSWSKRSRKLEERLRRMARSAEYFILEESEEGAEDQSEETKEKPASTMTVGVSRFTSRGVNAEPSYDELKARLAELEKQVAVRSTRDLEFKIGQSGGVSVYEQWIRLSKRWL